MRICGGNAHNVKRRDATGGQSVCDETPMAAPGNCLRAHDDGRPGVSKSDDTPDGGVKTGSVHVVRISSERVVLPGGVDRVPPGMPQAAQARLVFIGDSTSRKGLGHRLAVVLRITAGFRNGPDIDEIVHAVRNEHCDEIVELMRRVTDGVNTSADKFRIVS